MKNGKKNLKIWLKIAENRFCRQILCIARKHRHVRMRTCEKAVQSKKSARKWFFLRKKVITRRFFPDFLLNILFSKRQFLPQRFSTHFCYFFIKISVENRFVMIFSSISLFFVSSSASWFSLPFVFSKISSIFRDFFTLLGNSSLKSDFWEFS